MGGWMWGGTDERQSVPRIQAALDQGGQPDRHGAVFTALAYPEEIVAAKRYRRLIGARARIISSTKAGVEWDNGSGLQECEPERGSSRKSMIHCAACARTASTSIMFHWPDPLVPIEETAEPSVALYQQGKIGASSQ